MSSIVGVFNAESQPVDPTLVGRMIESAQIRGNDRTGVWDGEYATVAAARYGWELSADFSGDVLVLDAGDVVVAADASLYYRNELEKKIEARGVSLTGDTPSHYLLAAYRAWGEDCVGELEGDFSFILYDRARSSVLCARDFAGLRPLFFAEFGKTLVVASTVGAILTHPECSNDLNLASIACTSGGMLWSLGSDTCYSDINVVPAATRLVWRPGQNAQIDKYWTPREDRSVASLSFDEASEVLCELLEEAVSERLANVGVTTVWMSGGRDSTAVFGAGQNVLKEENLGRVLRPISISYPEGDPGREDEIISAVADFWGQPVHWLDIDDIPLFEHTAARAAEREEPGSHLYENWNRALGKATRDCGSRIALDGNGGDQLFQATDVYLADLFVTGRWVSLARELWAKRQRGRRHLFQSTVHPILSPETLAKIGIIRGRRYRSHYLERPIAPWLSSECVARFELSAREREYLPERRVGRIEKTQLAWSIQSPMPMYQAAQMGSIFLQQGIQFRSPLFDKRIVEFAISRPWRERARGLDSKLLLRRAMKGLLPDDVLASRDIRSGTTVGYSRHWMNQEYPALFGDLFEQPLRLAELGIVNTETLKKSVKTFLEHGGEFRRVGLFHALQAELWLRGHENKGVGCEDGAWVEDLAVAVS